MLYIKKNIIYIFVILALCISSFSMDEYEATDTCYTTFGVEEDVAYLSVVTGVDDCDSCSYEMIFSSYSRQLKISVKRDKLELANENDFTTTRLTLSIKNKLIIASVDAKEEQIVAYLQKLDGKKRV